MLQSATSSSGRFSEAPAEHHEVVRAQIVDLGTLLRLVREGEDDAHSR